MVLKVLLALFPCVGLSWLEAGGTAQPGGWQSLSLFLVWGLDQAVLDGLLLPLSFKKAGDHED